MVKSILGGGKKEFSEAPRLIRVSYFLQAEGTDVLGYPWHTAN